MKNFFLGKSPLTTIAGYALAGLYVAKDYLEKGETNKLTIGIGIAIAILGRITADANKV